MAEKGIAGSEKGRQRISRRRRAKILANLEFWTPVDIVDEIGPVWLLVSGESHLADDWLAYRGYHLEAE